MKIKLGIVDKNRSYVRRLIDYFTSHYPEEIEVFAFSDVERLKDHIDNQRLDVILADEDIVSETIKLSKSTMLAYFSDSIEIKTIRGVRTVCRYQRAEQIYREILNLYAELDRQASYRMSANASPLILFMGTSGGSGTTTVSAACAISLAQSGKKVLYLNLEENGVINHIFRGEGQMTLSDVLYAVKSNRSNLALKLESMVQRDKSGVYFYTPFHVTLDSTEMKAEDLSEILSVLTKYGSYDAIIVDSESAITTKRSELVKVASIIFVVGSGTEVSNMKLNRLLEEMNIMDESNDESRVMSRIQVLYNQMSHSSAPANTKFQENVFASIGVIDSPSALKIAEEIAKKGVFDQVLRG